MNEVPVMVSTMVEFTLDGDAVQVPEGSTILDACRREGIDTVSYTHLTLPTTPYV